MSPGLPPPPSGYSLESLPPPPSGYSIEQAKPEQSFSAALQEFGRKMNPITMAQGLTETVAHPIEAAKSYSATNQKILSDAEEAFKRGDYVSAARHAFNYVANGIPGLGAALEEAGNKMEQGDYAGSLADTAALGSQIALGTKAPAVAEAAQAIATGTKGAVVGGIKGGLEPVRYGHLRLPLPASAAGAAAGHYVGRMVGAPELGAVAGAAYPVVRGAIQGAKEALAARGATAAAAPETAAVGSAAATVVTKSPGQLLAESDGKAWNRLGTAQKQLYEQIAASRPKFEANVAAEGPNVPKPPRTPESYGVTASQQAVPRETPPAAEAPPSNPTLPTTVSPTPPTPVSAQPAPAAAPNEVQALSTPAATPESAAVVPEQLKTSGRTFVKDARPSAEDYTLVQVPTDKLDAAWSKEGPAFYIPPGGGGVEIGGRLPAAKQFIESGQPIEAPRVSMAENGRVVFEDGRHRFAAVRDAGDKTTAVMVPNEQVGQFKALNKPSPGPQTPADIAKAATAKGKADRFIAAIQRYNIDFPERQPITSKGLEGLGDAEKSILTRQLKNGGYLKNSEEFTDTSFPYIVQGLKDAESGGNLAQQLAESIRRARANRASAGR